MVIQYFLGNAQNDFRSLTGDLRETLGNYEQKGTEITEIGFVRPASVLFVFFVDSHYSRNNWLNWTDVFRQRFTVTFFAYHISVELTEETE